MTDDLTTLASAYLDGETSPAERAQVEADTELLAEVERLRRVRAVVADTEEISISVRERHLAGALDAWDRIPTADVRSDATPPGADAAAIAGVASITAPTPLGERRRRQGPISTRVLTAAAAIVVVAGAGVVVNSSLDSGNNADVSADVAADDLAARDGAASAEFAIEPAPADIAEETFDEGGDGTADETIPAVPVPAAESDGVQGGAEEPPNNREFEVLTNGDELARFANDLVLNQQFRPQEDLGLASDTDGADQLSAESTETEAVVTTPPTLPPPVDTCGLIDDFVGFARWQTAELSDDPVAVGIDNSTNEAVAYRAEDCTLVARSPLPND